MILTFQHAGLLVAKILPTEIVKNQKLIVDLELLTEWNSNSQCYLWLYVSRPGTMQVEKKRFCKRYVQIRYFEGSWPAALVAHRFQPLPGSMRALTKKRNREDEGNQQWQSHEHEQRANAQDYVHMLHNLQLGLQEYLLLSDDNQQSGALQSLALVCSTAEQREHNRICIWLDDYGDYL